MNGKQKAYLKSLANKIPAIFQVGKSGINDNFINQVNDALEARELIKISILENALLSTKETAGEVAEASGAEVVQVIGNKFILYKESKEKPTIILP